MRLADRDGRVEERVGAGAVGADLVAGRAVRRERLRDRAGPPAAVPAVLAALPLADPTRELALEGVGGVAEAEDREDDLGARDGAPILLQLVGEDGLGVPGDRQLDRLANGRRRAGGGRRASRCAARGA